MLPKICEKECFSIFLAPGVSVTKISGEKIKNSPKKECFQKCCLHGMRAYRSDGDLR